MEWTQWLPLIAVGIALLGIWGAVQQWGAVQHRLGKLEARMDGLGARMDGLERGQADARAENIRLHEETRAEFRREIRLILQVLREHTHADGSPATTPIPVDGN